MEIINAKQTRLKWKFPQGPAGLFEAIIWNGKITQVNMCKNGSSESGDSLHAYEHSENFLRQVYTALGELLQHLDALGVNK